MPRSSSLTAVLGAAARDVLQEAHREEMAQAIDARVVGRPAELRVELAELPVAIAAELIESSLVAWIVDRSGEFLARVGAQG